MAQLIRGYYRLAVLAVRPGYIRHPRAVLLAGRHSRLPEADVKPSCFCVAVLAAFERCVKRHESLRKEGSLLEVLH